MRSFHIVVGTFQIGFLVISGWRKGAPELGIVPKVSTCPSKLLDDAERQSVRLGSLSSLCA